MVLVLKWLRNVLGKVKNVLLCIENVKHKVFVFSLSFSTFKIRMQIHLNLIIFSISFAFPCEILKQIFRGFSPFAQRMKQF
jgi:hypothetical protein